MKGNTGIIKEIHESDAFFSMKEELEGKEISIREEAESKVVGYKYIVGQVEKYMYIFAAVIIDKENTNESI